MLGSERQQILHLGFANRLFQEEKRFKPIRLPRPLGGEKNDDGNILKPRNAS